MSKQKYVKPPWKVEFIEFTKDDARKALAKFEQDRTFDPSWVEALRRTMDAGLWDPYSPGQAPLCFDRDGNRLNGGHRLRSLIESKLDKLVFPVIRNLNPEDFARIDQDAKLRRHGDAHLGRAQVYRDEARINWLEAIVTGNLQVKVTQTLFEYLADHKWRKQIQWANEVLPKTGTIGKAPWAAPLMYAHRADAVFADPVGRAWANGGAGLPPILLHLRDKAMSRKDTPYRGGARADRVGITLKMLNVLALMHQKKALPTRVYATLAGLSYFSGLLRDGAAERWAKKGTIPVNDEE